MATWLSLDVTANAFLQHMVRNITGTLVTVGMGEEPVDWVGEVLESRDRKQGGRGCAAARPDACASDIP